MQDIDLTQRPRSRAHLADWYSAVLADQSSSGLSIAEYALELGVSPMTLYQWKRRLAENCLAPRQAASPLGLIEISTKTLDQPTARESQAFVLRLRGGRHLELPGQFEAEELHRIIEVLESC